MRLALVVPPSGKVARSQTIVLEDGEAADVGGAADCRALIDHPSVGTARIRIERKGAAVTVQDVEGLGKCTLGGVRLRPRAKRLLRAPASVWLGDVECTTELEADLDGLQPTREVALRMARDIGEAAADTPVVRIAEGARMGASIALERDRPRIIGRGTDADLFIEDSDVSRRHLRVEWRDDRVLVTDLGTTAGTYLGGAPLAANRAAVWPVTHMIVLGKTVLLLEPTTSELLCRLAQRSLPEVAAPSTETTGAPEPARVASEPGPGEPPSRAPLRDAPIAAAAGGGPPPAPTRHACIRARVFQVVVVGWVVVALVVVAAVGWMIFAAD